MAGIFAMGKTARSFVVSFSSLIALSCAHVNPTAPDGSVLHISANPTSIASGGAVSTITVVGYDARGIPLSDGTAVRFTTDIGDVDEIAFILDGKANATLRSDNRFGEAHIVATSGNSKGEVKVLIGLAALALLSIAADPLELPQGGGQSYITATACDANGNVLSAIPVVFSTNAGSLNSGGAIVLTDYAGVARDTLITNRDATVTARSGDKTANVIVTVRAGNKNKIRFLSASSALE